MGYLTGYAKIMATYFLFSTILGGDNLQVTRTIGLYLIPALLHNFRHDLLYNVGHDLLLIVIGWVCSYSDYRYASLHQAVGQASRHLDDQQQCLLLQLKVLLDHQPAEDGVVIDR